MAMNAYLSRPQPATLNWQFSAKALLVPLIAAAGLSACSTPAVRDRVIEVKVPIATHPIKPADVPVPPAPLPPRPQSLSAAADVLLADHCSWVAFGLKAWPLLRVSAGLPPQDLPSYPECEGLAH
jgi:hypothetical protein